MTPLRVNLSEMLYEAWLNARNAVVVKCFSLRFDLLSRGAPFVEIAMAALPMKGRRCACGKFCGEPGRLRRLWCE